MYPYPGRGAPPPPQQQQQSQPPSHYGRGASPHRSPEQMRASLGRSIPPRSPSSALSSHDDGPREWHHRPPSGGGGGGGPEMREMHYPSSHHHQPQHPHHQQHHQHHHHPPPPSSSSGRYGSSGPGYRDHDDRYPPPPSQSWIDDRPYSNSASGPNSRPPPMAHHHSMDDRSARSQGNPMGAGNGPSYGAPPPPHPMHNSHPYSHPASPSHRPRTPPRISRMSGGSSGAPGGASGPNGNRAPPSWDPVAPSPMSAPPSLVPRLPPGGASSNSHPMPLQQTSPILPALSSRAGSEGRGHARVPSWGPHAGGREGSQQPHSSSGNVTSPSRGTAPPQQGGSSNNSNGGAYRGASMDRYATGGDPGPAALSRQTSAASNATAMEKSRKRPASESPPSHMSAIPPPSGPGSQQQASPTQRGDVMSMSSILGPSGNRAASATPMASDVGGSQMSASNVNGSNNVGGTDKRRKLEGNGALSNVSPVKMENASRHGALPLPESTAASLARRKWSGPIAEEAAQQAAAWRAQEQRWGTGSSSRSPKVGGLPLGNGAASPASGQMERHTSPFGIAGGRGASPMPQTDGGHHHHHHRRQRSDGIQQLQQSAGQPIDARSPLARNAPLRGPTTPPPPPSALRNVSKQQQQQQPPPPHSLPPPQAQQQQQGPPPPPMPSQSQMYPGPPPPGFYHGHSPPPPPNHHGPLSHQPGVGPPPPLGHGHPPHGAPPYPGQPGGPPPAQVYGQPSYHAYDSQGRPVEIDVDEVRGGAYAGHGNPHPPAHMVPGDGFRHVGGGGPMMPVYDEPPRGRMAGPPSHSPHHSAASTRRDGSATSTMSAGHGKAQAGKGMAAAKSAAQQQQAGRAQQQQHMPIRDRGLVEGKPIRRSLTPVMPGPAKGLLPARTEAVRSTENTYGGRPLVPAKDFNSGPKVDSEAVISALKEVAAAPHGRLAISAEAEDGQEQAEAGKGSIASADQQEFGRPIGQHLGSFLYDSRKSPLLPGDLLRRNVGATLEVRIPGRLLGAGPTKDTQNDSSGIQHGRWALGAKANPTMKSASNAPSKDVLDHATAEEEDADMRAFWEHEAMIERKAWGTDVYTDDSDVLMMCLHTGWLEGPATDDVPSWVPPGKAAIAWRRMTEVLDGGEDGQLPAPQTLDASEYEAKLQRRSARLDDTMDVSVTLRIAPKLIAYKGSQRGGVKTRSWGNTHDGVSLLVEHVSLMPPGYASGERGLRSMKQRIDQLARLKMLATIAGDAGPLPGFGPEANSEQPSTVNGTRPEAVVRKQILAGGLLDILAAAQLTAKSGEMGDAQERALSEKRFWQFDPHVDVVQAS